MAVDAGIAHSVKQACFANLVVREFLAEQPRLAGRNRAGMSADRPPSGTNLPRRNKEIAKLHEEIASTREMVALSLLQQQSATERLRGVDYTGRMQTMEPEVVSALTEAVAHDPSVNVRLAR